MQPLTHPAVQLKAVPAQQTFDHGLFEAPIAPAPTTVWFARFPRQDLGNRSRCNTVALAALAANRDARSDKTIVKTTIQALAEQIGATATHVGRHTLRELEAEGSIIRQGGGWTIPSNKKGWFKFPSWALSAGLSRTSVVVLLNICSKARENTPNERITVTYGQMVEDLNMNRNTAINAVKELEAEGVIIAHRSRAEGRSDYNNPNRYTVCYRKRDRRKPKICTNGVWSKPAIRLIDRLAVDPEWEQRFESDALTRRMRQRVEQALDRLQAERPVDDIVRKVAGGRGVGDVQNIWMVLCHRLAQIPLHSELPRIKMQAQFEEGLISKAQLDLAIEDDERRRSRLRNLVRELE